MITIIIGIQQLKIKRKSSALGIGIASLVSLYFTITLGATCFDNWFNYQDFDQKVWHQSKYKSFEMAKTIVKDHLLLGLTKEQVVDKIGNAEGFLGDPNNNLLEMRTDESWHLRVEFKDNVAINAYLWKPQLILAI